MHNNKLNKKSRQYNGRQTSCIRTNI